MKTTEKYGPRADLALSLWVKLVRAFSVLSKATSQDIERYGLTQGQFGVLECLGHLGPMTLGQLSKKKLVSGGNMTVVVDNLEKLGLVERRHCKDDRRSIYVGLTEAGQQRFEEIFPKHAVFVESMVSGLTTEEQVQLSALLKKLGMSVCTQRK